MAPKIAVVYCRVSSMIQTDGISLSAQKDTCASYLGEEKFSNVATIQEIASARSDSIPPLLKTLMSKRNTTIIFYSVDRFSRNVEWGQKVLNTAIKNNNTIIFVRELLVLSKNDVSGMEKFREALTAAKNESDAIADRVKTSISAYKAQGFHIGTAPYGYSIQPDINNPKRKRLVQNPDEQAVIKFINLASTAGSSMAELNAALEKFSPIAKTDPIVVEVTAENKTEIASNLHSSLSREDIAGFLNLYGSDNRGRQWTAGMVTTVLKNIEKRRDQLQPENKEDEKKSEADEDEKKGDESPTKKQCWNCRKVYRNAECCFTVFQFSRQNGVCVNCEHAYRNQKDEKSNNEISASKRR